MKSNDILPKTRTSQIAYRNPITNALGYVSTAAQSALEN